MSLFLTVVVLVEVAVDRVVSRTVIHLSTCDLMTCFGLLTRNVKCVIRLYAVDGTFKSKN